MLNQNKTHTFVLITVKTCSCCRAPIILFFVKCPLLRLCKIPSHFKRVTTLPCEIMCVQNSHKAATAVTLTANNARVHLKEWRWGK